MKMNIWLRVQEVICPMSLVSTRSMWFRCRHISMLSSDRTESLFSRINQLKPAAVVTWETLWPDRLEFHKILFYYRTSFTCQVCALMQGIHSAYPLLSMFLDDRCRSETPEAGWTSWAGTWTIVDHKDLKISTAEMELFRGHSSAHFRSVFFFFFFSLTTETVSKHCRLAGHIWTSSFLKHFRSTGSEQAGPESSSRDVTRRVYCITKGFYCHLALYLGACDDRSSSPEALWEGSAEAWLAKTHDNLGSDADWVPPTRPQSESTNISIISSPPAIQPVVCVGGDECCLWGHFS